MEKRVTFEDTLINPCHIEGATSGSSHPAPASISSPASDHVYGSLDRLESAVVKIELTERLVIGTILAPALPRLMKEDEPVQEACARRLQAIKEKGRRLRPRSSVAATFVAPQPLPFFSGSLFRLRSCRWARS
jgi:hypothetical protein